MKRGKVFAIIFVPLMAVFAISSFFIFLHYMHMHDMRFYNTSFHGVIKKIARDEKNIPTLNINDELVYLNYHDPELCEIIVGDSIVKRSGEMYYSIYRKDSSGKWIMSCRSQTFTIRGF